MTKMNIPMLICTLFVAITLSAPAQGQDVQVQASVAAPTVPPVPSWPPIGWPDGGSEWKQPSS